MNIRQETNDDIAFREIFATRNDDQRISFVSGNFNVVHPGHLRLLKFAADLTGLFWTKLCEKLSLERNFSYAEEEVQRGADRGAAPSD